MAPKKKILAKAETSGPRPPISSARPPRDSANFALRFPARFQENLGPEKANYRALARRAGRRCLEHEGRMPVQVASGPLVLSFLPAGSGPTPLDLPAPSVLPRMLK